jgi:hypothetical protein
MIQAQSSIIKWPLRKISHAGVPAMADNEPMTKKNIFSA